jgi:DNA-binding MarR family transcriptional regulator
MDELFSDKAIRPPARRGERRVPMGRAPAGTVWPPRDRDSNDVAVVAARLLSTSGRLVHRVNATARRHDVDPYVVRLLLLFADHNRPLRIGNIAELLNVSHATAGRAATRAEVAGLVDKFVSAIDGREVIVRLTYPGRAAVTRCLDAIRRDAAEILGLTPSATLHPQGDELTALLGPPPSLRRTSENAGWRAGVRIGMRDQ